MPRDGVIATAVRAGFRVNQREAKFLTEKQRHNAEVRIPPSPPPSLSETCRIPSVRTAEFMRALCASSLSPRTAIFNKAAAPRRGGLFTRCGSRGLRNFCVLEHEIIAINRRQNECWEPNAALVRLFAISVLSQNSAANTDRYVVDVPMA